MGFEIKNEKGIVGGFRCRPEEVDYYKEKYREFDMIEVRYRGDWTGQIEYRFGLKL